MFNLTFCVMCLNKIAYLFSLEELVPFYYTRPQKKEVKLKNGSLFIKNASLQNKNRAIKFRKIFYYYIAWIPSL